MAEPRSVKPLALLIGAIAIAAVAGTTLWFFFRGDNRRPVPQVGQFEIPAQEAGRLLDLKNTGIAQLENEKYTDCDAAFAELAERIPDDPIGPRNLAIARLLNAGEFDPMRESARRAEALNQTSAALAAMQQREKDSAAMHILTARWALAGGDEQLAADELTVATERAPDDPATWYELYSTFKNSKNEALREQSQAALKRAFQLRPENLHLLIEMLQSQARAQDPDIRKSLNRAKEAVQPFAEAVRQRNKIDLPKLLEEALAAVEGNGAKKWSTVMSKVTIFANLLRPELATRLDLRRITRHAMDLMIYDFKTPIAAAAARAESNESIPVRIARAPDAQQLPPTANVRGVALADFDLDGRLDVILSRDKMNSIEVYTQTAEKGWKLIGAPKLPFSPNKLIAVDLDRDYAETPTKAGTSEHKDSAVSGAQCLDADVDLIATGEGGAAVLRNRLDATTGNRTLELVEQDKEFSAQRGILAAAAADVDHDGDLDLVFSRDDGIAIWSNRDNFTFADISARSSLPPKNMQATELVPVDWNRNIDLDILACSPTSPTAGYLENVEHGRFRWMPFDKEFTKVGGSSALALIDADGNASWDLASAGANGIHLTLTSTRPAESVHVIKEESLSSTPTTGLVTWDFDNDGYQDLLAWSENAVQVFRGGPNAKFTLVEGLIDSPPRKIESCHVGDVDGDGDEDLLIVDPDRAIWFLNEGGNKNHWIDVAIRAEGRPQEPSERCNIHGIGSLLELKAGPLYQPRVVAGRSTHFGLGKNEKPDVVRVLWTNGIPHNVLHPAVDQPICEQQQLKGSCPYLYTWTGSKYEFLTDCLWNAPIGLQFASGVLAPAREWEYLTIPGDRLVPVDGEYRMQLTEELWEATYFDQVKLIAVDHPDNVRIYSNEKVGPAEIAKHRIHTVRHPRLPVSARDKHNHDILESLARQDRKFVKAFDRRIKQGLVDEHYLELDLGDLKSAKQITLFITGWIFPTDVTVNISVDENPNLAGPKPPSLWVPDGKGDWKEAIPFMGFPGGKTKTMAVDLSGLFSSNDYRVRIKTSNEIYWDAVFFTADETPAEVHEVELPLVAADLHYRGCSQRVRQPDNGPEWYDYAAVETKPLWPPMLGHFTRFGDVTSLLANTDDCLAIIGAGDEMTVRFKADVGTLPAGWRRDFLLYNVGWDKDADLNTVYGQTVEPLPYAGMSGYPHDPERPYPDTPRHRDYLQQYQTREQNTKTFWYQIRDFNANSSN